MKRVLLVDDNQFERDNIRKQIESEFLDVEISEADNGITARDRINQHPVDILVTDIKMPLMDGVALIKQVRFFNKQIKIVVISGYDDFEYARGVLPFDVSAYLLKPVNCVELRDALGEFLAPRDTRVNEYSPAILRILELLENEYDTNLTLEYLSEQVHLVPSYLGTLFKKEVGISFSRYLNELRMKKAAELLRQTNIRVVNVASFVGISDSSYFGKVFRQQYGVTPAEYRKKHGITLNHD
ncbi:response regulator transcription factor [Schleiferilactobacillus shenzhenensis]|uniref:RhaR n=1 Tax=Schleiferilactobacillus shenzhenensis LY-73 TaxID=1231336 RepID=U4TKN2_9LACO|nr:response regulator [Schleiferilactobacillus shenzhenensis]ERL64769.1 RhaR [Schleiferilactobacillus shenzhenensis LY-73]